MIFFLFFFFSPQPAHEDIHSFDFGSGSAAFGSDNRQSCQTADGTDCGEWAISHFCSYAATCARVSRRAGGRPGARQRPPTPRGVSAEQGAVLCAGLPGPRREARRCCEGRQDGGDAHPTCFSCTKSAGEVFPPDEFSLSGTGFNFMGGSAQLSFWWKRERRHEAAPLGGNFKVWLRACYQLARALWRLSDF